MVFGWKAYVWEGRGGQTREMEKFIFLVMHYDLVLGREGEESRGTFDYIYIYMLLISVIVEKGCNGENFLMNIIVYIGG